MIGARIKEMRENKGMSQLELADMLHIGNTTLSQYETNKRIPSDEIKIKIADYFNVSIDYLIGKSNIENPYEQFNPLNGKKLTSREKRQLGDVLEQAQALFFDNEISDDDKEKFIRDITDMFWEAKAMNKRNNQG